MNHSNADGTIALILASIALVVAALAYGTSYCTSREKAYHWRWYGAECVSPAHEASK